MPVTREFSHTMAELRRQRGLSQRAAAADLRISQALLSHYENGAREPGLNFVRRACQYYGVSADYLLGLSDRGGPGDLIDTGGVEGIPAELRRLAERLENALEGTDA